MKAKEKSRHNPFPPPNKHVLPRPLWQPLWHGGAGSFVPKPRNYVYSISHNLFSIDSKWICFSTTDDLARKQTPLKQEPSKALLGSVRHPQVWVMPPPWWVPHPWGQVTSTTGSPGTSPFYSPFKGLVPLKLGTKFPSVS